MEFFRKDEKVGKSYIIPILQQESSYFSQEKGAKLGGFWVKSGDLNKRVGAICAILTKFLDARMVIVCLCEGAVKAKKTPCVENSTQGEMG